MGALGKIVPLVVSLILLTVVGAVCFVAYSIATEVADKTSKKMQEKHISLSRDGATVGVRTKSAEEVGDSTQSVLMKAWNASSWPDYKSRLGWGQSSSVPPAKVGASKRKA